MSPSPTVARCSWAPAAPALRVMVPTRTRNSALLVHHSKIMDSRLIAKRGVRVKKTVQKTIGILALAGLGLGLATTGMTQGTTTTVPTADKPAAAKVAAPAKSTSGAIPRVGGHP